MAAVATIVSASREMVWSINRNKLDATDTCIYQDNNLTAAVAVLQASQIGAVSADDNVFIRVVFMVSGKLNMGCVTIPTMLTTDSSG
ncbi:hypothetical protein LOY35_16625 [Pseudomonas sp. B21-028]|uniref:hypothetical protein n=1 Tax=Pseudomonas sp. B21-028 TaxID=2895480 RepID=UPI0021600A0B|nr:hypothetical protein [Pseudomonas sp. B21-028]UVL81853.1 hypothetical protein LOY35_16625 [Pseudomonas sp. B21-028]